MGAVCTEGIVMNLPPNNLNSAGDRWSSLRFWVTVILVSWLLGAVGLRWLIDSIFILIGLAIAAPVLAMVGLQWWVKRSIVTAACPVCEYEFSATRQTTFQCPNCGEPLQVQHQKFTRMTPPGTIDVEVQTIE